VGKRKRAKEAERDVNLVLTREAGKTEIKKDEEGVSGEWSLGL